MSVADAGRLWGARFSAGPEESAWALGVSTHFDVRLWREDLAGSRAHAGELERIGVLTGADRAAIDAALVRCGELFAAGTFPMAATDEDLHGAIERWLVEELGELGGRLRAGRSRNDQIVSDLRLWSLGATDRVIAAIVGLQEALLDQAETHLDWLAPAYTHLQRAQPVVLAQPLLAFVWMLQRDAIKRPQAAELLTKNVFSLADDTVQRRRVEVAAFFANPSNDLLLYREIIELLGAPTSKKLPAFTVLLAFHPAGITRAV